MSSYHSGADAAEQGEQRCLCAAKVDCLLLRLRDNNNHGLLSKLLSTSYACQGSVLCVHTLSQTRLTSVTVALSTGQAPQGTLSAPVPDFHSLDVTRTAPSPQDLVRNARIRRHYQMERAAIIESGLRGRTEREYRRYQQQFIDWIRSPHSGFDGDITVDSSAF